MEVKGGKGNYVEQLGSKRKYFFPVIVENKK